MSKIAPILDDTSDLPGLARDVLGIHLKQILAGTGVVKVPKLNGLMKTTPGMYFHFMPELFVQLAGINAFECPHERFNLYPGQLCVMPRGMPHGETFKLVRGQFGMLVFMYTARELNLLLAAGTSDKHPRAVKSMNIHYPRVLRMAEYLEDIAQVLHAGGRNTRAIARGLLSAHLAEILNIMATDSGAHRDEPYKITQVKQMMFSRLSDPELGVRKLAEWVECAPDYLSYLFHKWTGRTLADTINRYRLSQAQYLLQNSSRNIKEIAAAAGFADPDYFGRLFHNATGQTPTAYRRKISATFP
ncbi:MAG: AraC family transcriptional regulator [Kiritimatiellaeota bacterium]|nr:AraC family transcriptional regulator [Kiritimatiellota bacterium]